MTATDDLYRSYLDLRWHFDPPAATAAGLTGHDHRLGDFSAGPMREHLAAFRAMGQAVELLGVKDQDEEIDRTAFLDEIRITVARFEHERPHVHDPTFWLSHLYGGFQSLLRRRQGTPAERARGLLERLRATPAFLHAARETVHEPPRIHLDTAAALAGQGSRLFDAVVSVAQTDPAISREELNRARGEAEEALTGYERALREEFRAHRDDLSFAIGEEQFNRRLHHEHALAAGAPEVYRYGLHLVDQVEAEVAALAREIAPGVPWRAVVERLRNEAAPGGDLVGVFRETVDRAREFLTSRGLVTLVDTPLEVVETPPFLRPLMPFAAYSAPVVFGDRPIGTFYVTPPAAATARPSPFSRYEVGATVVHESWPGHHLQMATARKAGSLVRRLTWTPLTVEGWALYCEELMTEEGFFPSLEERLFQRVHLLWRAVRIVLDVGLHTRGMTPEEAVTMLVDRVAMDRSRAAAEVSRYCAWPTYQLCYAVGRRELLALREAWRAAAGPSAPLREFHDRLLGYGGLPVSLSRWGMGLGLNE